MNMHAAYVPKGKAAFFVVPEGYALNKQKLTLSESMKFASQKNTIELVVVGCSVKRWIIPNSRFCKAHYIF